MVVVGEEGEGVEGCEQLSGSMDAGLALEDDGGREEDANQRLWKWGVDDLVLS